MDTSTSRQVSLTTIFSLLLVSLTFHVKAAPTTDGEILDLVRTANNAEIRAGELAQTKATSSQVREFATTMVKAHKKSNSEAESVTQRTKVDFENNDQSEVLKKNSDAKIEELQKTSTNSRAFDKKYMEQQVSMHKSLLENLDKNLIPSAKNSEVKDYLEKTKSHVKHHLTEATEILTTL